MSKKLKYIIIIALIVFATLYMLYLVNLKYQAQSKEKNMISQYVLNNNKGLYKNDNVDKELNTNNSANNNQVVGIISIPKISVEAPITSGTSFQNFRYSVTHLDNSALPGSNGNSAFAANDSFVMSIFENLDNLNMGNKINVQYEGKQYVYEVTSKKLEKSTSITAINQTTTPTITLIEYENCMDEKLQIEGTLI